jgi:hypothetical protein
MKMVPKQQTQQAIFNEHTQEQIDNPACLKYFTETNKKILNVYAQCSLP